MTMTSGLQRAERKIMWQAILALMVLALVRNFDEKALAKRYIGRGSGLGADSVGDPVTSSLTAINRGQGRTAPRARQARVLILVEPNHGQFSQSRESLLEAAALAAHTNRTLVARSFTRACKAPLSQLFTLGSPTAGATLLDETALSDAPGLCGDDALYIVHDASHALYRDGIIKPPPEGPLFWKGQNWTVRTISWLLALESNNGMIISDGKMLTGSSSTSSDDGIFPPTLLDTRARTFQVYADLAARLATLPNRCVAIHALFFSVDWHSLHDTFRTAVQSLQPAPGLTFAVTEWIAYHGLADQLIVGVYLRGQDVAGACRRNQGSGTVGKVTGKAPIVSAIAAALRATTAMSLDGKRPAIVLASDDREGRCATLLQNAFPSEVILITLAPSAVASGRDRCFEAAFAQEVLARTDAFVGSADSEYSAAVHWSRVFRYGAHSNSTLWL